MSKTYLVEVISKIQYDDNSLVSKNSGVHASISCVGYYFSSKKKDWRKEHIMFLSMEMGIWKL